MGDSYLVSASVIGTAASDHSSMAKIKMLSRHLEILRNCFSFTNFVQIAFESYGPGVGRFVFLCCISRSLFLLFFFLFPDFFMLAASVGQQIAWTFCLIVFLGKRFSSLLPSYLSFVVADMEMLSLLDGQLLLMDVSLPNWLLSAMQAFPWGQLIIGDSQIKVSFDMCLGYHENNWYNLNKSNKCTTY